MAQKTLLELSTDAPERAVIRIDGKTYELRGRDDLGLKEDAEFRRMAKAFGDTQPDGDWQKLAGALDSMVGVIVLGISAEVLAKLSDVKKLKIVEAFTKEVAANRPAASLTAEAEPMKETAVAV